MKVFLVFLLSLFYIFSLSANKNDTIKVKENEILIKNLFNELRKNINDSEKENINEKIRQIFSSILKTKYSFYYSFDSLNTIGKIYSKDSTLRIYSWNLLLKGGLHKYYAFIQYKTKDSIQLFELNTNNKNNLTENNTINSSNWYGALYYEIIDVVTPENSKYYVLLGLDFNNLLTRKKIIDVLYFNNNFEPAFGLPVFFYNNKWNHRIIFEYSAKASMVLRYDPRVKMIVYDHLSPSHPMYFGKYQFYGPDFSYDGLKLQNGKWYEVRDIDIRNP